VRLGGGVADDAVAHTGGDQQPQPGQPGEEGRGEGDALAQGDHDVEVGQGGGQFASVAKWPGKDVTSTRSDTGDQSASSVATCWKSSSTAQRSRTAHPFRSPTR